MIIDDQGCNDILSNLEQSIVKDNFILFNEVIQYIFDNKNFSFSLKNPLAQSILRNLLFIWNLYDPSINVTSINLLPILTRFLSDKYIYKEEYEQTVFELLNICLIQIKINKNEIDKFYRSFVELISVIHSCKNKRIIIDILIEYSYTYFSDYSSSFREILQIIYLFNVTKKKNLDENTDSNNIIDTLNLIDDSLLKNELFLIEPLIYELLVLVRNDDYTIQTMTQQKLNLIFKTYIENTVFIKNNDCSTSDKRFDNKFIFEKIIDMLYDLLNKNNNALMKNILELFYTMNSTVKRISEQDCHNVLDNYIKSKICYDLFLCNYKSTNEEIINFYEGIMHIQYHIRIKIFEELNKTVMYSNLSKFSLNYILLPLIKHFLNPFTYIETEKGFAITRVEGHIFNLIDTTLEALSEVVKFLEIVEIEKLIDHLNRLILKFEKKETVEDDEKYINILYKALSKVLENSNLKTNFDFNSEFQSRLMKYIAENRERSFFDIIKEKQQSTEITLRNDDYFNYSQSINTQNSNIVTSILLEMDIVYKDKYTETLQNKRGLFNSLRRIMIDHKKKTKKKDYYLRNFAVSSFLELLKQFHPTQVKYEITNILLEIINNLKNRNFSVREKAREGLKMIIKSYGPYLINYINEELRNSLCHGYQRYVLGYTVSFLLNTAVSMKDKNNLTDLFDFILPNVMEILLEEIFGEVAEDREVETIAKRYIEAKNNKSLKMFTLLASKMDFKNSVLTMIFNLKAKLAFRENDNKSINKANEVIYHIVLGLKQNLETICKDELLILSYSMINHGLEINLKNSNELSKTRNLIVKGDNIDIDNGKRDFKSQFNDTYSIQIGAASGKNYMIEISKLFMNDKNEIIIANLFTYFGLELVLIGIKNDVLNLKQYKKLNVAEEETDNFNHLNKESELENFNKVTEQRFDLVLQKTISCLKISNSKILSKSLKILTLLFDYRLIIIKNNLKKIVSTIFRNLNIFGSEDVTMTQALISSINKILLTFSFTRFTNTQIKILIDVLTIHINNYHIKPYVYSCLDALIKKKVIHPSINDMVDFVKEGYLQSFEESSLRQSQNVRYHH